VRSGQRMALTEIGESFLPYVERTLSTLDEGTETIRQVGAGARGRVTIGAIQPLCGDYLTRAVRRFTANRLLVSLFVRIGHTDQVIEMLHDRLVRIGFVGRPVYGATIEPLYHISQPLSLIVPAQSPLAREGSVADRSPGPSSSTSTLSSSSR